MRVLAILLIVTTALAACVASRTALAEADPARQQAEDFELVKRINSRRGWEIFLKTYPHGPYADRAREELAKTGENWGDEIFIPKLMEKQRQRH